MYDAGLCNAGHLGSLVARSMAKNNSGNAFTSMLTSGHAALQLHSLFDNSLTTPIRRSADYARVARVGAEMLSE